MQIFIRKILFIVVCGTVGSLYGMQEIPFPKKLNPEAAFNLITLFHKTMSGEQLMLCLTGLEHPAYDKLLCRAEYLIETCPVANKRLQEYMASCCIDEDGVTHALNQTFLVHQQSFETIDGLINLMNRLTTLRKQDPDEFINTMQRLNEKQKCVVNTWFTLDRFFAINNQEEREMVLERLPRGRLYTSTHEALEIIWSISSSMDQEDVISYLRKKYYVGTIRYNFIIAFLTAHLPENATIKLEQHYHRTTIYKEL